ncbi:hypothetical protein L0Y46_02465 [bacterium]|nr:hypothetical protein [bacterium]
MDSIDFSHHAYLLEGNAEDIIPPLLSHFEKEHGIRTRGNPNVWVRSYDTFGIDDARVIKEFSLRVSVASEAEDVKISLPRKIFVIAPIFMTREAQNALLKILEEPPADTHFFIIVAKTGLLLGTLQSRLQSARPARVPASADPRLPDAMAFLSASPAKRLMLIEKILKDKDKAKAIALLNSLEEALAAGIKKGERRPEYLRSAREIILLKDYLNDTGLSVKMILEYAALTVPAAENLDKL